MRKAILQGIILVCLFFGTWLVLMQIDWLTVFNVQKIIGKTEQKLGDLF